jgi:hypothetical protein
MPFIPDAVPEVAIDYDEIFRRGGRNCGDEHFALMKCPHCGMIYLVEYEVDTLYPDPTDLNRRVAINIGATAQACVSCGGGFPTKGSWIGPRAPAEMQVTWEELRKSPWRWVTTQSRGAENG